MPKNLRPDVLNNLAILAGALTPQKSFLEPAKVEQLAAEGLSKKVICNLFSCAEHTITDNQELLAAFEKGRAQIGQRIRKALLDDALLNDSMPAKLYLDKIYGGDIEQKNLAVTVTQSPLEKVSDAALLEIDLNDETDDN